MAQNENDALSSRRSVRLGRLPRKSTRKALMFSDFFKFVKLPPSSTFWTRKAPIPPRAFGNLEVGNCTRASQANAILRMERLETRRLPVITDEEVKRVYAEMSARRYGGGDNGAYETDALDDWRNPDTTIRDDSERPLTIDAYLGINPANQDEVRAAFTLAANHIVKLCMNLPAAYADRDPPAEWGVPASGGFLGDDMPGSWGGHSLEACGYTARGVVLDHTWNCPQNLLTWEALAAYCDEMHLVIDSVDAWRKQERRTQIRKALGDVADAVNGVSAIKVVLS